MYCTRCGASAPDEAQFCTTCGASLAGGSVVASSPAQFRYHGDGGTLLGIMFVNFLLTIVTIGVYSFWARIKIRKYVMQNTELSGERFLFHGTGLELLIGALKAAGILMLVYLTAFAIQFSMRDMTGNIIAVLIILTAFVAIGPLIIVGSRKYRASRTSYRNIRFSFRGTVGECASVFYPGLLLTIVTLGIYYPVFANNLARFTYSHTWYGSVKFEYDGDGQPLIGTFCLSAILAPFTLGLSMNWWWAAWEQHIRKSTSILGARFHSNVEAGNLLVLNLTNALLTIFTLGIGYSWAITRKIRYFVENLTIQGTLDLNTIHQQAHLESAIGEGMGLVVESDASFFDISF